MQILIFLLFLSFSCTMRHMLYFMKKILHILSPFLLFFWTIISYADDNFSSTDFTVDLSSMNPLWSSASPEPGAGALYSLIWNITDLILFLIPILAAISLLIAGYFYIFSAGDSEKAGKAKTIIKWNIVAIFVAFLSYGIIKMVTSFF